ncbi:MAG: winged helix-turn-helix transcriptional regulator [Nitrososphaerales archaeon]
MIHLADEILSLIAKKGQIAIRDVQDRLGISKQTANSVIDFLMKFGFVEFDGEGFVKLSEPCKKFFVEIRD